MASKNLSANIKIGASLGSSIKSAFGSLGSKIKDQNATLKQLRAAFKDAGKGVGEYAGKLDELGQHIAKAEARLGRLKAASKIDIGASLSGVGNKFMGDVKRLALGAGIVAASTAAVGASIFSVTKSFVDWADDIGDSAEALGISSQALQTWQYAAATVGVDAEKMTGTIAKFNKTVADGADGTKEIFAELGISFKRLSKLPLDTQLKVTAEAFKKYSGTGNKAAMAMGLMGKSGYKLTGILSQGAEGFDNLRKAGEATGAVLTDGAAKAAGDAAGALDGMGISLIGIRNKIAIAFVPTLQKLAEKLSKFADSNGKMISEWADKFGKLIENNVVPAIGKLIDKMPKIIDTVSNLSAKIWDGVTAARDLAGGWANLGAILIAVNFLPTIIAVGALTVNLYRMAAIMTGMSGPIGIMVAAIGGLSVAIYDLNQEQSKTYDWLSEKVPSAMRTLEDSLASGGLKVGEFFVKLRIAARETVNEMKVNFDAFFKWLTDGFDIIGKKISEMWQKAKDLGSSIGNFFGGGGTPAPSNLTSQIAPADSMPGSDTRTAQNNSININVSAPGADGAKIARDVRTALTRKPLFDSDGALVPA